jgi:nitrogen fixation protein FixH
MKKQALQRTLGMLAGLSALAFAATLPVRSAHAQDAVGSSTQNAPSKEAMKDVPRLKEKQILTVTGKEDWSALTGFGADAGMAEMMTQMMVGGSGMEHMKMGPMKPGMKMASMPGMPMGVGASSGGMPVTVTLSQNPPIIGDNTLDVLVTDAGGKPMTGLKLMASVAMTSMDMGTAKPKVTEGKDGHYAVTAAFSMKGPWQVTLMTDPKAKKGAALHTALTFDVGSKDKWVSPQAPKAEAGGWQVIINNKSDMFKVGMNTLDVTVLDPTGKPVTGAKITSSVAMTSMDMGTAKPKVTEGKNGHYTTAAEFSMKGPWRVSVTVTPPNQKPFRKDFDFTIAK